MEHPDVTLDNLTHQPDEWARGLNTGVPHEDLVKRLTAFAYKWGETVKTDAAKEDGYAQRYWHELLEILGAHNNTDAEFERVSVRKSTGRNGEIDVFIPGLAIIENKSPKTATKKALDAAIDQAWDYIEGHLNPGGSTKIITLGEQPRFIVGCNLTNFRIYDRLTKTTVREFTLKQLPKNADAFWFVTGASNQTTSSSNVELDKKAAELMGAVYDELVQDGVEEATAATVTMRLLFLCVADDLDLLGRKDAFTHWLATQVREDGSDLGIQLQRLFTILDQPKTDRQRSLRTPELDVFPHVNGSLFHDHLNFDIDSATALQALRKAVDYDWARVNPAIFGAMFQRLRTKADRHSLGQHYTSEADILKVIGPLFLDEIHEQFENAKGNTRALNALRGRIKNMQFLDPAAGSGNFLLTAYKHLSDLNLDILRELRRIQGGDTYAITLFDFEGLVGVTLDQFHGIEIDAWPCELARTALHIARAQANRALEDEFTIPEDHTFPLPTMGAKSGVVHANALQLDWSELVPMREGTYIFGNPPFLGSLLLSDEQKADARRIWNGDKRVGTMDFVTNWFLLAARHMTGTAVRAAFVSTNSITQGEQPAVLWGAMYPMGISIDFAHRTFPWRNGSGAQAGVHCVIVGFSAAPKKPKVSLWTEKGERVEVAGINAYLTGGPEVVIGSRQKPLSAGVPEMRFGSMPRDGGFLSKIDADEASRIRRDDSIAAKYLRPLVGAEELINGKERYCLWTKGVDPSDVRESRELRERLDGVREMRASSRASSTRKWADRPHLFVQDAQPTSDYLAVPGVSSERYVYVPMAVLESDSVASNALLTIEGADVATFGLLASRVFNAWNATVSGRLESRLRISAEITYNNFPFPELDDTQHAHIAQCAQAVIDARAAHPNATLADLYGQSTFSIYSDLKAAHDALDEAVLAAYGLPKTATDAEILKVLFDRYAALVEAEKQNG